MNGTSSPIYNGKMHVNGTMAKGTDVGILKKFLMDMKNKNFDGIKFATYRAAAKLLHIQLSTDLHLVDIYNMIEAFRENGLNTLDHNTEIDEARLECIVSSIYFALYKRLPSTHNVDIERDISLLTQLIMHVYDSEGLGRIKVLAIKTAFSILCAGRLVDKLRYAFSQFSESNGILNEAKFESFLRELQLLPVGVGEEPSFGYNEEILNSFFKPNGPLHRSKTSLEDFLDCFLLKKTSGSIYWVHMFQKLSKAQNIEHTIQCKACGRKPFNGLRYKCLHCYNYQLCQDCFWRDRVSGSHTTDHDMREYGTWNKGERGTSVRKKLLCSPAKSATRLPEYPKEPELNKTLDMTNIVPPMPSEYGPPISPISNRSYTCSSPNNTLSSKGSKGSSTKVSQESITRMDDEHRLIARYAKRLASENSSGSASPSEKSVNADTCREQREMISSLEEKNRNLLKEIRKLRMEHEETVKNAQQMGCNPNLLSELRVLRQRKDELEMRMSALQETRRELMVQLEGLMKLLKNNQGSPRPAMRISPNMTVREILQTSNIRSANSSQCTSPSPGQAPTPGTLSGVNGDVRHAFGKGASESEASGRNLRSDLLNAVNDVTGHMSTLVTELNNNQDTSEYSSSVSTDKSVTDQLALDLDMIMNELSSASTTFTVSTSNTRSFVTTNDKSSFMS